MKKSKIVSIRLNKSEMKEFEKLSQEAQMSISKFFKESALKAIIIKPNKDLIGIISGMNRIGNNLNQIARKVNANFYIGDSAILLNELKEIDSTLKNILAECKKC